MSQLFARRSLARGLFAFFSFGLFAITTVDAQWQNNVGGNSNWQQGNRWQLGVQVNNTNTGVLLTQVIPGSAAANQGLVSGDRILAVGGDQVGYVDNRLVDLGDKINQHITPSGQVTLLVLTARGQLRTGPLTLTMSGGVIKGTVVYQGGVPRLTPQAVLNVRMLDVTYNPSSGLVVAQTTAQRPNRSPFYFEISYDPTRVYNGHRYAIEAQVVDSGRIVYQTQLPVDVTLGSGGVSMVLVPATTLFSGTGGVAPGWGQTVLPYEQVAQWYQSYLGRPPTQQELNAWVNHLNRGQPLEDIQSYLLSSSEFFDRYQNNPNLYLRGLYRTLYGVDPTPQQLQGWRYEYDQMNGVRSQFVQQVVRSGS